MTLRALTAALILLPLTPVSAPAAEDLQFVDIAHLTCAEAWTRSGESEETFVKYALVLANHTVERRKIAFPDTKEAGDELGDRVVAGCVWDPDNLLFAVIDRSVRSVVEP